MAVWLVRDCGQPKIKTLNACITDFCTGRKYLGRKLVEILRKNIFSYLPTNKSKKVRIVKNSLV